MKGVFQKNLTRFAAASVAATHPDKERILYYLSRTRATVSDLVVLVYGSDERRGMFQSAVSGHLSDLKSVGLIKLSEKEGRSNFYVVNTAALNLLKDFEQRWLALENANPLSRQYGKPIFYANVSQVASACMTTTKRSLNRAILSALGEMATAKSVVYLWRKVQTMDFDAFIQDLTQGKIANTPPFAELMQNDVSNALRRLRSANLVTCVDAGRNILYQINQPALDLLHQFEVEYEQAVVSFFEVEYEQAVVSFEPNLKFSK